MELSIHVDAYAGYRAEERPRRFELDGVEYRIYGWDREWRTPAEHCYVVRADGKRYLLRYHFIEDRWTLGDEFDGPELYARPHRHFVLVARDVVRQLQRRIIACEHCHPDEAQFPLAMLLDEVLCRTNAPEYLLSATTRCTQ